MKNIEEEDDVMENPIFKYNKIKKSLDMKKSKPIVMNYEKVHQTYINQSKKNEKKYQIKYQQNQNDKKDEEKEMNKINQYPMGMGNMNNNFGNEPFQMNNFNNYNNNNICGMNQMNNNPMIMNCDALLNQMNIDQMYINPMIINYNPGINPNNQINMNSNNPMNNLVMDNQNNNIFGMGGMDSNNNQFNPMINPQMMNNQKGIGGFYPNNEITNYNNNQNIMDQQYNNNINQCNFGVNMGDVNFQQNQMEGNNILINNPQSNINDIIEEEKPIKKVINVIFRRPGTGEPPIMIHSHPNEKVSELIKKYTKIIEDYEEFEGLSWEYIFKEKELNRNLTLEEARITNNENIFVRKPKSNIMKYIK